MDTRTPTSLNNIRRAAAWDIDPRVRLVGAIAAIVALPLLVWHYIAAAYPPKHELPPPPVHVGTAALKSMAVVEHTIGTVVANATVQVTARVEGQLNSAAFKEGQIVQAGQLLFQIDPRPFEAALQQAQAQLAKDRALLLSAQNDRRRFDALFEQNATSSQQRDQADATAKSLAASVKSDQASIDVARLNLGYTQIRSPIDGKTGPILIQPGNLVTANGSSPLVQITQVQPVKISFSLPQADLPRIQKRGLAKSLLAAVDVHGAGGARIEAPVDFVGNSVSDRTGTIELRATFDNRDLSLVPGQLVDVTVTLDSLPDAIVVPRDAVNAGPDRSYVYVVDARSRAIEQPVDVLYDDGTDDAIRGNVKAGDRVVTEGQLRIVASGTNVAIVHGGMHSLAPQRVPGAQ